MPWSGKVLRNIGMLCTAIEIDYKHICDGIRSDPIWLERMRHSPTVCLRMAFLYPAFCPASVFLWHQCQLPVDRETATRGVFRGVLTTVSLECLFRESHRYV